MPKKYYIVKQISRDEYFKQAEAAGNPDNPRLVDRSISGSWPLDKKTYLAYTEDNELTVELEDEDE